MPDGSKSKAFVWFVGIGMLVLVSYQVYKGAVLKRVGIPGFEVEFADPPVDSASSAPAGPAVGSEQAASDPIPKLVVLEGTQKVLRGHGQPLRTCSSVETTRDCHNKKDGEDACPSWHTLSITAQTDEGKLRDPKIECTRDDRGSCEWNKGSGHFSRAKWDFEGTGHQKIVYRVPVSSRSIDIRVCATEDQYSWVPETRELGRWEALKAGSKFAARVPAGATAVLKVEWEEGEQSVTPGKSAGSLVFVRGAEVPAAYVDYSYEISQPHRASLEPPPAPNANSPAASSRRPEQEHEGMSPAIVAALIGGGATIVAAIIGLLAHTLRRDRAEVEDTNALPEADGEDEEDQSSSEAGISQEEVDLLSALGNSDDGCLEPDDLAEEVGLGKVRTRHHLDVLEQLGLVDHTEDPMHGYVYTLTADGRAFVVAEGLVD